MSLLEHPPTRRRRRGRTARGSRGRRRGTPAATRPSKKRVRRSGASRKSSALRDGGVSSTSRSKRPVVVRARRASPSPCTPASRRRRSDSSLVDRGWRGRVAGLGVGRVALDQLVEGALRVEHHRPQLAVAARCRPRRAAPGRRGAPRCRARPGRARRRAAAPGRSSARRRCCPRAAMPSAIAAEVVVLPTPPEPAQTMHRACRRARRRAPSRARAPARRRAARARRGSTSGVEQVRQRSVASADRPRRRRRELGALRARGARSSAAPQRRRAPPARRGRRSAASDCCGLGAGEALGQQRVDDDARRARAPARSRSRARSSSVSLTGISSAQRDRDDGGLRRVGERSVDASRPGGGSGRRARSRAKVRGRAQHREPVAGRGRVDDHEVVGRGARRRAARAARAPRPCRSSPARACPGVAGGEVRRRSGCRRAAPPSVRDRQLVAAGTPRARRSRVDRDREQVLGPSSASRTAAPVGRPNARGSALLAGHLGRRSCACPRARRRGRARPRPSSCRRRPCR